MASTALYDKKRVLTPYRQVVVLVCWVCTAKRGVSNPIARKPHRFNRRARYARMFPVQDIASRHTNRLSIGSLAKNRPVFPVLLPVPPITPYNEDQQTEYPYKQTHT